MIGRGAILALPLSTPALAHDNGRFGNVPPDVRTWFKAVKSPNGIPCCEIADGDPTDHDMRENQYWASINGEWMVVPAETVVDNEDPTGQAVVW